MELRESLSYINSRLGEEYGYVYTNHPNFRVVFSDDQFEKRWTQYTDEGFELSAPEVRLLPKYRQWITAKYVLERLIPVVGETDLTTRTSYEPCWVFQTKDGQYLPPFLDGCKLIIDSLLEKSGSGHKGHAKYKDPNTTKEERELELKKVEMQLFGNETELGDHLAYKTGIVVPDSKLTH